MIDRKTLYITGAGVSAESGIPTFRGEDGYWTIGSENYTPEDMATCETYREYPDDFLEWYYRRFVAYDKCKPNLVHRFLSDKNLITQNVDGLDNKANNRDYIPIHGRIDLAVPYKKDQEELTTNDLVKADWWKVRDPDGDINYLPEPKSIKSQLLEIFDIDDEPEEGVSLKPFVLLFDEYYTNLYRIDEAMKRVEQAEHIVFMGTSFSVLFPQQVLDIALKNNIRVDIVDPEPMEYLSKYDNVTIHKMKASEYIIKNHFDLSKDEDVFKLYNLDRGYHRNFTTSVDRSFYEDSWSETQANMSTIMDFAKWYADLQDNVMGDVLDENEKLRKRVEKVERNWDNISSLINRIKKFDIEG